MTAFWVAENAHANGRHYDLICRRRVVLLEDIGEK